MSGGFNQPNKQVPGVGNWQIFVPQSSKGKYEKYNNQICMIVSITYTGKRQDEIKAARLYLTDAVDKILGRPDFIKIGTRGSNVGIIPLMTDDGECYAVMKKRDGKEEQIGMSFVNINAFAKLCNLKPGVYEAHSEAGVIVFDTQAMPSRP